MDYSALDSEPLKTELCDAASLKDSTLFVRWWFQVLSIGEEPD